MKALKSRVPAAITSTMLSLLSALSTASATDFTAEVVMEKMDPHERTSYIQGVVEGLAYSRYKRDNQHIEGDAKTVTGMKCVYDWFYEKPNSMNMIYAAFGKFPTYTPAAIINALVEQSCPG